MKNLLFLLLIFLLLSCEKSSTNLDKNSIVDFNFELNGKTLNAENFGKYHNLILEKSLNSLKGVDTNNKEDFIVKTNASYKSAIISSEEFNIMLDYYPISNTFDVIWGINWIESMYDGKEFETSILKGVENSIAGLSRERPEIIDNETSLILSQLFNDLLENNYDSEEYRKKLALIYDESKFSHFYAASLLSIAEYSNKFWRINNDYARNKITARGAAPLVVVDVAGGLFNSWYKVGKCMYNSNNCPKPGKELQAVLGDMAEGAVKSSTLGGILGKIF